MPSIQDVADQINARLDLVVTHTESTAENTADTLVVAKDIRSQLVQANATLGQIQSGIQTGFANLSQGLFAILQVQIAALELLDHERQQNDTIICELVNANTLLCNIMRKLGHQLELSEASLVATRRIEGIEERAHCCEAGDYDRDRKLEQRMEACCPPEEEPEEACPAPCDRPSFRRRSLDGQDWKPLPAPQQPDPVR